MPLKEILDYQVVVEGVQEDGHSIQKLEMTLAGASQTFDMLHKQYPENTVRCFQLSRKEIFRAEGQLQKEKKPVCPRGCKGLRDGRPVVKRTQNGKIQCSICGYLGD